MKFQEWQKLTREQKKQAFEEHKAKNQKKAATCANK